MSIGYKNITKCQIGPAISDSEITILLENISDYVPFLNAPGDYVYAILADPSNTEIIKIDVAASSTSGLSAARGQGGTAARAWRRGTLLYQELTAESLDEIFQQAVFRTVSYNPNGFLSPAYIGEKVFQDDATACKKRWWKSWDATNPVWILIAGTICDGERTIYPTDPEWDFTVPDGWDNGWPVFVDYSTLKGAGYNYYGQLGQGDHGSGTDRATPILISNVYGRNWRAIGSGSRHCLGIDTNGTLWTWGYNNDGQLGLGGYADMDDPSEVGSVTTWGRATGSVKTSIAIRTDGTMWVWGDNASDYLGLGLGQANNILVPTQVGTETDWVQAETKGTLSWALKSDGTLWGWGYGSNGYIGLGHTAHRYTPEIIGTGENITSGHLTIGTRYKITSQTDQDFTADGAADNNVGTSFVATGTNVILDADDTVQIVESDWASLGKLGGSSLNSVFAIKTSGALYACGFNGNGELGIGNTTNKTVFTLVSSGWSKVAHGSGGDGTTLGIKTDGTLWSWGSNILSKLGLGYGGGYVTSPAQIGTATDWVDVAVGVGQSLAVKSDGTAYSWGYNQQYCLGIGSEVVELKNTPQAVAGSTTAAILAAGEYHSLWL